MLKRAIFTTILIVACGLTAKSELVFAAKSEINIGVFNKLAIHGYDPVVYFTDGKPTQGDTSISLEYKGARWAFSSEENRELFKTNPEQYAPQYGGHCAYAASRGYVADVDPIAWRILNDKLYLNYDLRIKRKWESDLHANIEAADKNWPDLLN